MKPMTTIQSQLLVTKLYVPTSPGTLIPRPRLHALLDQALMHPFTLISAPAGFGKTTLLSTWAQALPASQTRLCWLSLDEEDNDPRLFWTYILSTLSQHHPHHFHSLLTLLQSQPPAPLKSLLSALINLITESKEHLLLILDDYQVITEEQVHTTLTYLLEHLPAQLHLILSTRADPPFSLTTWRARRHLLEVRTDQLRCTPEEIRTFLQEVMGLPLPDQLLQEVTTRTEGWLVSLQLLGLSLPEHAHPASLLQELCGDQHYILDYLTQVVLKQQSQEVQTFLLSTSILERLSASLCDAVMEQTGSQQMLEQLTRANLFIVSLDHKRQWYRYHALFAEALHSQLEQSHADLVPTLHGHASRWYAQQHQITPAILHACKAKEWHWVADLLEEAYPPLVSFTWGVNRYALFQFRQRVEQLPVEILAARPHFCLACVHLLWTITPDPLLSHWLDLAEAALRVSPLTGSMPAQGNLSPQEQRELLGKMLTLRAYLQCYTEDGPTTLVFYEQALASLSLEDATFRAIIAIAKAVTYYTSSANDANAAIENGYQSVQFTQEAGQPIVTFNIISVTALYLIGAGRLHEADQLIQQALLLQTSLDSSRLPEAGWVMLWQAEILRERNELDVAQSLATEAFSLCEQSVSLPSLLFFYWGYAMLIRVCLSRGDVDSARIFLQQAEQIGQSLNQPLDEYLHSFFTTVDQVRLWLACGELDQAIRWADEQDVRKYFVTSFARERQQVALGRVLLAQNQPSAALQCLEPALQRATAGRRWSHVIGIRLLQALAHQRLQQETQALSALSEAIHLAEPEGYIRSFVEEGEAMEALLYRLRKHNAKLGPTLYLDTLLFAFAQERQGHHPAAEVMKAQLLPEPLSERELEVLHLLVQGQPNQQIAQELVITINTVKRHVSHIFAKLGVSNRIQAIKQAQVLGLLHREEP